VAGVVQGVGFRPFVHRLATELGLAGHVGNDTEGSSSRSRAAPSVERFEARLVDEAPAAGPDLRVEATDRSARRRARASGSSRAVGVGPDVRVARRRRVRRLPGRAVRPGRPPLPLPLHQLHQLRAPLHHHRPPPLRPAQHHHARVRPVPACAASTTTRRTGASTPSRWPAPPAAPLWFEGIDAGRGDRGTDAAIAAAQERWPGRDRGVKGLGGYHLACDATSTPRSRAAAPAQAPPDKPFAVMVATWPGPHAWPWSTEEAALLTSPERPIVLLRRRAGSAAADQVAPGTPTSACCCPTRRCTICCSARCPGRPGGPRRAGDDQRQPDRRAHLLRRRRRPATPGRIADAWLVHDRPIHVPCDDSVVRVEAARSCRSGAPGVRPAAGAAALRGPSPAGHGGRAQEHLLPGVSGRDAWMSQHIGDMGSLETLAAFERSTRQFAEMYASTPGRRRRPPGLPDPPLGRGACRRRPVELVQHHHAHIAAVMAEHGVPAGERVIGFAFDGTGYGTTAPSGAARSWWPATTASSGPAHLRYVPLPGGDATIRKPYRAALAHLWAAGIEWAPDLPRCGRARRGAGRARGASSNGRPVRADLEHGPALRRGQLAARGAPHRLLRGAGGHRARVDAAAPPGRGGAATTASTSVGRRRDRPGPVLRAMIDDLRQRAAASGRWPPASTWRWPG
jgi:hydrogenase maturation protein HypF